MRGWALILVALDFFALGCGRQDPTRSPRRPDVHAVSDVVARVDGHPIGAADVAAHMAKHGVDASTALEALIERQLLMIEAHRRGVALSPEARRQVERTMVRAMLHDFEADLTPESISAEEVRADFEAHKDRLQIPERRSSWHILVRGDDPTARALAESIHESVQAAESPRDVFERYAASETSERDTKIKAEELPPITRRAAIEDEYKNALFEAKTKGLIEDVVETSYGFHVIVLTQIIAAERQTVDEVEQDIRERLSQKKRFDKLLSIVRALEAEGLVEYDDQSVQRLLSASSLPKRAE